MKEVAEKSSSGRGASKDGKKNDVDVALDKIFTTVDKAIKESRSQKLTLEHVDKTLYALFDAVNRVHKEGKNVKVPDFKKILASAKA